MERQAHFLDSLLAYLTGRSADALANICHSVDELGRTMEVQHG